MNDERRQDGDPRREVLGINRRNLDLVFAGYRPGAFRDLDDKLRSKARLEGAGVATPATIGVIRNVADLVTLPDLLAGRDEVVIKPAKGWGGRGILVLVRDEYDHWTTPGGHVYDEHELRTHVEELLTGTQSLDESEDQVILEERIHAHPFLQELYPDGLSDLRVVVEDGDPIQAMLRVPTDASDGKANLHGGGLGLGIDLATGTVVHAVQRGVTVHAHPDTGAELVGRVVPEWSGCLELARAAAQAMLPVRYVGVDIVLDARRGPLVLEVNARPGLAIQIANRSGQPVRRRTQFSRLDRVTQRASWIVLALLAVSPWMFAAWQAEDVPEVRAVRPERWSATVADGTDEDVGAMEWSDEAVTVSLRSDQFAGARAAAASGDTLLAESLYREAIEDSSLAPFALNNLALLERSRGAYAVASSLLSRAVTIFPDYARGHYNLGLVRRDGGRTGAAEISFRRSLALRPSHARSWSELGELLLERGAADSARIALEQAVRFEPDAVADRRRLARAWSALGRPGAAAVRYAQAMALAPSNAAAALGWIDARLELAARDRARLDDATMDSLRAALEPHLGPRSSDTARLLAAEIDWWGGNAIAAHEAMRGFELTRLDAQWLNARAVLALELGLWDDVRACILASDASRLVRVESALQVAEALTSTEVGVARPALEDRILALAWHAARGDSNLVPIVDDQIAIDDVERAFVRSVVRGANEWSAMGVPTPARLRALRADPRTPISAALLLWSAERDADARAVLDEEFPDFRPRMLERFLATAQAARTRSEFVDPAHALGRQLLRTDPTDAAVLIALATLELDRDATREARSHFDRLSPDALDRPDAQRVEARLLLAEGKSRLAQRRLAALARENPLDAESWHLLALAQRAGNRSRDAVRSWRRALELEPENAGRREALARTLSDVGDHAAAVEEWQRLVALDLDAAHARSARFNLALALQRTGRLEEAIAVWDALLAEMPEQRSANYNRALALERLGRYDEAIAGFERVLELDPGHAASRERLQRLRTKETP